MCARHYSTLLLRANDLRLLLVHLLSDVLLEMVCFRSLSFQCLTEAPSACYEEQSIFATVYGDNMSIRFFYLKSSCPAHHLSITTSTPIFTAPTLKNRSAHYTHSQAELLLQNPHCILWVLHAMPNRPRIIVDLPIIAALKAFVPKEVDVFVFDTRDLFLLLDVLQTVGLVPACWEDIEGDLTAY